MTLLSILLIGFGAGVGALCRYLVSVLFFRTTSSVFPWATWFVNLSGTFALGLVLTLVPSERQGQLLWQMIGPGFCGGFTTFSTMMQETVSLMTYRRTLGILYITTSMGGGLLIAGILSLLFTHNMA